MDIEAIRRSIEETRKFLVPRSTSHQALTDLLYAIDAEGAGDDEADEPPVSVDDGFAILPMERYEALRQAEEHLQETRFATSDGEHEEIARLRAENHRLDKNYKDAGHGYARLEAENRRLKADLKQSYKDRGADLEECNSVAEGWRRHCEEIRTAAAPPGPEAPRVADEVLLKHIQDHQAEIEGIKDRLDEQSDRLHGFIARMNKIEVMTQPIGVLREPVLGPDARKTVEEAKTRLLKEAFERGAGRVESSKP